jgi:hypothetical protein
MYLTPARFRSMDLGIDVSALTDAQLNRQLMRAASALHNHTAAPITPEPHDFRGGVIIGETHTWRIDPYLREVHRRIFPYHVPVLTIQQCRIYATKTQYIELAANELYYEVSEGWLEPTSANLTSFGLFGAAILPFVGLSDPHVSIDYTYGRNIAMTERLYYPEEAPYLWRASVGFWNTQAPAVRVNGTIQTSNGSVYTVDPIEGTITFVSNFPEDGDVVEIDYVTTLHPDIQEAQAIITAGILNEKALVASGLGGLRAIRVAELSLERDYRRTSGSAAQQQAQVTVPPEAAALLEPFAFRGLAFA